MPDVDDLLAQHIAHLFIRDSISLFSEKLEQDIHNESDHFEVCLNLITSNCMCHIRMPINHMHA